LSKPQKKVSQKKGFLFLACAGCSLCFVCVGLICFYFLVFRFTFAFQRYDGSLRGPFRFSKSDLLFCLWEQGDFCLFGGERTRTRDEERKYLIFSEKKNLLEKVKKISFSRFST
jgi:hypothetical protein